MKKYIIVVSILTLTFLLYNFLCFNLGLYIPRESKKIDTIYKIENKQITKNNKIFDIKGVNIGTTEPGLFTTDYNISKRTYMKWFKQIKDMGANTIRIDTIVNDEFYKALYQFNKDNKEPLYLIQGILIKTYPQNNRNDAYDKEYYKELVNNAKIAVDVVHGRRKILANTSDVSSGNYNKDISKYTIGYVINIEMHTNTILYTNSKNKEKYEGTYITTNKDANGYETMLAKVLDQLVLYETSKYHEQRIVTFENSPITDPFDYSDEIKYHYKKGAKLDINHIIPTKRYKSGLVAAYQAYSYFFSYTENETDKDVYYEYLKKLNEYHNYPVLITRFGYSTSRGRSGLANNKYYEASGLTEEEQGKAIVQAYDTIKNAGCIGALIDEWSDNSNKSSRNSLKRVDLTSLPWWHDVESAAAGKGLLKFESGKEETLVVLDGSLKEYSKKDKVISNHELDLYMKPDFKYMYFGIKLKDNKNTGPLNILLDTTEKSGSKRIDKYNIRTERPVDFLIRIDNEESRILVQERYNSFKALDYYDAYNRNPYLHIPRKDSREFRQMLMIEREYYKDLDAVYHDAVVYETGKLKFGSTDKGNTAYNTQSDYYQKHNIIEIRIPWVLLNFSDPTTRQIHGDYFKNYGVENIDMLNIYVGASTKTNISLEKYKLGRINNDIYHEELKDSYKIVKERWSK